LKKIGFKDDDIESATLDRRRGLAGSAMDSPRRSDARRQPLAIGSM
jgi:hypothetical protein